MQSIGHARRSSCRPAKTVLSDGESLARARCGNRLSTRALAPVGPDVDLDDPPEVDLAGIGRDAGTEDIFSDRPLLVHDLMPPLVEDGRESEAAAAVTAAPEVNSATGAAAVSATPGAASTELTQSFLPGGGWIRGAAGGPAVWAPAGNLFPGNLPPPPVFGELPSIVSALQSLPMAGRFPSWSEVVNQFYAVPLTSSGLPPTPFVLPPFNPGGPPVTAGKIGLMVPPGGQPAPPGGLPGTEPPAGVEEGPDPPPGGPPTQPPSPSATPPAATTPPLVPSGPPLVDTPEPATLFMLLGAGALGLALRRAMR